MTTHPSDKTVTSRLNALIRLMERLESLHVDLKHLLETKLDTMRGARLTDMQVCLQREQTITERIGEQEGLRKQLMAQLGRGFGLSPDVARRLSALKLAERLTEPHRTRLNTVAMKLKTAVFGVKNTNELIGRVTAQVLNHLDEMFTSITTADSDRNGYSPEGHTVRATTKELFEAVG